MPMQVVELEHLMKEMVEYREPYQMMNNVTKMQCQLFQNLQKRELQLENSEARCTECIATSVTRLYKTS